MQFTFIYFDSRNTTGKSDPYVKIIHERKKIKTKTKKQTNNPVWNEQFEIKIKNALKEKVIFEVWDKDVLLRDDFIGALELNVSVILNQNGAVDQSFQLNKSKGTLFLSIQYVEDQLY